MKKPSWPAPTWVRALTTTQQEQNLALPAPRRQLCQTLGLKNPPSWLKQVHGPDVVEVSTPLLTPIAADGAWTQAIDTPCVVLTADCLPLLLTDTKGSFVAAVHCGWRGIASGIIENLMESIRPIANGTVLAWLGPAISPQAYEVGEEVRQAFIRKDYILHQAFYPRATKGKWSADLYRLAKITLHKEGVNHIYGGDQCTFSQHDTWYSHRRQSPERMATLIWLTPHAS